MDRETLRRLEMLNQLSLTQNQVLDAIDTENVERMVHVMPVMTVVREDVVVKTYTAHELQKDAPETDEGYWCVPRVVE